MTMMTDGTAAVRHAVIVMTDGTMMIDGMTTMIGGIDVVHPVVIVMTDGIAMTAALMIDGTTMMTVGRDGIEDPHPHAALISEALITHHHLLQDLHGDGIIATTLNPSMDQGALGTIVRHITSFCRHLNP